MKINILGVDIDNLFLSECLEKIREFLKDGRQHYIVTPNPEFVMTAQKDVEFREILNKADMAVPDGAGLIFAGLLQGKKIRQRICGVDLIWEIAKIAGEGNYSIYLLGAGEGIAKRAAEILQQKFPSLKIAGAESGGIITSNFQSSILNLIENINNAKPDILLVALGHPKQEKWLKYNLSLLPSVKIAMAVGGAFDFISNNIRRAPRVLRSIGLEWFWRLLQEPWRWRRIVKATILFPLKALIKTIFNF